MREYGAWGGDCNGYGKILSMYEGGITARRLFPLEIWEQNIACNKGAGHGGAFCGQVQCFERKIHLLSTGNSAIQKLSAGFRTIYPLENSSGVPMKRKILIILVLLLMVCACGFWWYDHNRSSQQVHYLTEKVTRGNIRKTVNATGEVDAVQLVTVGSQASGKIMQLNAEIGQKVKKGDLIAQIDPTTRENDLDTARAMLKTYQAQLESRKIALKVAQTKYDRELKLRKSDSTSRANLEDAENTLAAAKASVTEMESQILQQNIAVNTAETNLGYTKIVAPLDGVIVSVPVKEGQTVNANQTTPTIAQIADLTDMEIKIEVSEGDIPFIKEGMTVSYTLLGAPDKVYRTKITSIDPGDTTLSDATSSSSGASTSSSSSSSSTSSAIYYYAKARVANPDGVLRLSMTTQNVIEIDKVSDVLLVPSLVIQSSRGKNFVRVLGKNNQVETREVEVGLTNNVMTEIRSGLREGESVIATEMSAEELMDSLANPRSNRRSSPPPPPR